MEFGNGKGVSLEPSQIEMPSHQTESDRSPWCSTPLRIQRMKKYLKIPEMKFVEEMYTTY